VCGRRLLATDVSWDPVNETDTASGAGEAGEAANTNNVKRGWYFDLCVNRLAWRAVVKHVVKHVVSVTTHCELDTHSHLVSDS